MTTTKYKLQAALLATTVLAAPAGAQDGVGIEEIVVTAQKRAQNLEDAPVSITAFTAEQIESAGLGDLSEIGRFTPGLYWNNINISKPLVFIRGLGTTAFDAGSDPSVAVFLDEAYIARFAGMSMEMLDVERIEVLKGPQGTLYGRNSAGGAISVITQRATDTLTAKAQAAFGNYSTVNISGTVSGPLVVDKVKARLSFMSRDADGYVDVLNSPRDGFDTNRAMARGKLEFALADATTLTMSADFGRVRESMWAMENSGQLIAQKHPTVLITPTPGRLDEAYDFNGYQNSETWGLGARLDSELGFADLVSLTSFRSAKLDELNDFDASAADSIRRQFAEDSGAFQQEFRLASPAGAGPLSWVAGVYYFHENVDRLGQFFVGRDNQFSIGIGPFPGNGRNPFSTLDTRTIKNTSLAAFGQATYAVTDAFNVTVGGRYSDDKKSIDRTARTVGAPQAANPFLSVPFTIQAKKSWDSFDPAVILDYHVTENVMVYGSYKLGYKAGGFQTDPVTNAAAAQVIFNPENSESFEVGVKSDWLDRRLLLNVAAFANNYDDLQFLRTIPLGNGAFAALIDNVAEAKAEGVEVEVTALPVENLRLSAGYSYLDSRYKNFVASDGRVLTGRQTSRSPENQLNLDAALSFPTNAGNIVLEGHLNYTSSFWFEGTGFAPYALSDGYTLVDGRLSYESEDGQWRVALWGKNLTDRKYRTHNITIVVTPSPLTVASLDTYARPRTYGVELTWRFGN